MAVCYLEFELAMHGLKLDNECQARELADKIKQAALSILDSAPRSRIGLEGDVTVELMEWAGQWTPVEVVD